MKNKAVISLLLASSILFFILGLVYPILATKHQILGVVLKYQEVKLFDSVKMFYEHNDYLLATIIFMFTIFLPILKFIDIGNRIFPTFSTSKQTNYILHLLDKWSMLDVFLVALLLLNFKMDSSIIVMKLKIGTSFIALSIVFRMITTSIINYKNK